MLSFASMTTSGQTCSTPNIASEGDRLFIPNHTYLIALDKNNIKNQLFDWSSPLTFANDQKNREITIVYTSEN